MNLNKNDSLLRYYTGNPVFPFGYGLTYTNFTLSWTTNLNSSERKQNKSIKIYSKNETTEKYHLNLTNIGERSSKQTIFAYFKPILTNLPDVTFFLYFQFATYNSWYHFHD